MKKELVVELGNTWFWGGLQIAFIVLKLCGVIGWAWWLVLLPLIISVVVSIIGIVVFGLLIRG